MRVFLEKQIGPYKCWIRALNVRFIFGLRDGKVTEVEKPYKPEAQVYDPAACEVPDVIYDEAVALAAKILLNGNTASKGSKPPYRNHHQRNQRFRRYRSF